MCYCSINIDMESNLRWRAFSSSLKDHMYSKRHIACLFSVECQSCCSTSPSNDNGTISPQEELSQPAHLWNLNMIDVTNSNNQVSHITGNVPYMGCQFPDPCMRALSLLWKFEILGCSGSGMHYSSERKDYFPFDAPVIHSWYFWGWKFATCCRRYLIDFLLSQLCDFLTIFPWFQDRWRNNSSSLPKTSSLSESLNSERF